jgi:putative sulfotransferase
MRSPASTDVMGGVADIARTFRSGVEITPDTRLRAQLNLSDIEIVSLLGRLQGRYATVYLGPFFNKLSESSIDALQVGHLVEYLEQLLEDAVPLTVEPGTTPGSGPGQAIVLSNGRSGSTMLSDLLAEQLDTVVAQEFFILTGFQRGHGEVISAGEYWALLSAHGKYQEIAVRIGARSAEFRYPSDGRWAGKALPPILTVMLPSITTDPDSLFDVLDQRVPDFPAATVAQHNERLLNLLCELTGRKRWVERSGGTTQWTPQLLRLHPNAKFVYLTRNLEDIARSMSKHPFFRIDGLRTECIARFDVDLFAVEPGSVVPEEAQRYLPGRLTAQMLEDKGQDLRHFRWNSAYLTGIAEQALIDTPPEHLHRIRYEDILRDPETALGQLGRFLEFEDWADWAARVAGQVKQPGTRPAPTEVTADAGTGS